MGHLDLTFVALPIGAEPAWQSALDACQNLGVEELDDLFDLVGAETREDARARLVGLIETLASDVGQLLAGHEVADISTLTFAEHLLLIAGDVDEGRSDAFIAIRALKATGLAQVAGFRVT